MASHFWTPERDKRLQRLEAAGFSAAKIADRIGTTRNAVIGRSVRLRGLVFRSQIRKSEERAGLRSARQRERKRRIVAILTLLREAMAKKIPREIAIAKAVEAGGTYRAIGVELNLSRQRVHQIVSRAD
jgi:hypothetical protein